MSGLEEGLVMGAQSKKVMITGGAGFIGSELTHQAVASGLRVEVVDNLINGRKEYLADLPRDLCRLSVVDVRE
jgi:nucleoside-diphosphate-sugar epimerase